MNGMLIFDLLKENQCIGDLGSGAAPGHWWQHKKSGSTIDTFDLYNEVTQNDPTISYYKKDVTKLAEDRQFKSKYNLIVADHILEHVADPKGFATSLRWIAQPGAFVHLGLPAGDNFTDIFYRLIHRVPYGGHIQQFTYDQVVTLMHSAGFTLLKSEIWEDDWLWLEKCFSLEVNNVVGVSQTELEYLARALRKELTSEKGYLYGHEFVFQQC